MSMTPSRLQVLSYKLKHAAADGRLIVYGCNHCRRSTTFLATDLLTVWNPEMSVHVPPGGCSRCGKAGYMWVRLRLPEPGDVGHLKLRRPAGIREVQLWKDEWFDGPV